MSSERTTGRAERTDDPALREIVRCPAEAYEVLRGTGVAADVLVWTRDALESRLPLRASLPATVMTEGRLVYHV